MKKIIDRYNAIKCVSGTACTTAVTSAQPNPVRCSITPRCDRPHRLPPLAITGACNISWRGMIWFYGGDPLELHCYDLMHKEMEGS